MSGEHILITGAGTGIGRAITLGLARGGHRLSLLARRREPLEETRRLALEAGAEDCAAWPCDIRERTAVERNVSLCAERFGPLKALVANSGLGGPNSPGAEDRFDALVATNLTGTYSCLRAAEAHLVPPTERSHLLVVSSILARIGVPGYTGYCASKAGLLGLVRALAAELAPRQTQVNALCPGWVDTSMAREGIDGMAAAMGLSHDEAYAQAMSAVPAGRMSSVEEVARAAAWLISDDCIGMTGQGIDLNGGAFMI
jgi:NAD(P)-dependent dehydrogenase (short-subunit alcohol dehydrogenase family)